MKQYRHRITGNIATENQSESNYKVLDPRNFTVPKWIIENSNDWELVKTKKIVQKDYEILSFICIADFKYLVKGDIVTKLLNGNFTGKSKSAPYNYTEIEESKLLKNHYWSIHSVKRLSDGEIFTVDDIIEDIDGSRYKNTGIKEIEIFNNEIKVITDANGDGCVTDKLSWRLNNIRKVKKPIFKTADGVDIFEGDEYYSVHATTFDFPNGYGKPTIKGTARKGYWDAFSTKEKALEYIDLNKPKYSLNDIQNIFEFDGLINKELLTKRLKQLHK